MKNDPFNTKNTFYYLFIILFVCALYIGIYIRRKGVVFNILMCVRRDGDRERERAKKRRNKLNK